MAQSSNVSAGGDATAVQYNNLRADVFGAHHSDALGTLLVNADISGSAAIALSKLAALTTSRALVTNGSGVIVVSAVTATELGYLSGLVSKPVANSGDETVNGIKTFGSIPVLPASDPTTDNQASRKKYIDDRYFGVIKNNDLTESGQPIAGTTKVNLKTFVIPAGLLGTNKGLRLRVILRKETGTLIFTAGVNFGINVAIADFNGQNNCSWVIDILLYNTTASAQTFNNFVLNNQSAALFINGRSTGTVNTASDVTISVWGCRSSGPETEYLYCTCLLVELLNAPV